MIGEYDGCRSLSSMTTNCQSNSTSMLQVSSVEDTVLIPYSSGTTGLPKGVELTHRNLTAELAALRYIFHHCSGHVIPSSSHQQNEDKINLKKSSVTH